MTEEYPRRPVFIFLDAGVPNVSGELEEWRRRIRNEEIFLTPFLESFRNASTPDYRVTLFIQEELFSAEGPIHQFLSNPSSPSPVFIFFTSDTKFIEDARNEFISRQELQDGIKFTDEFIRFFSPNFGPLLMKVICLRNDSCEKRPALVEKMFNALKQYLN